MNYLLAKSSIDSINPYLKSFQIAQENFYILAIEELDLKSSAKSSIWSLPVMYTQKKSNRIGRKN